MNKNKSYEIDMSSGPILGKLLKFAVPLIFSSVLQLLFNAADIVVVVPCCEPKVIQSVLCIFCFLPVW